MKKSQPWHHTTLGTAVLWLGSIELAVPVLGLTGAALALGTYLDSTRGAKVAKEAVYGSWWFVALMGLICVSLIFAVVSRFPWKRRHVGFMTVHAALIALIAGGFISLFGRVEGHVPLQEGSSADTMETQDELFELVEHQAGQFVVLGRVPGPQGPANLSLAGQKVQVVERWENCRDEQFVDNGGPEPLRAVQVSAQRGAQLGWVGEEGKAGEAPVLEGLRVRVLPDGAAWEPAAKPQAAPEADYVFIVGDKRYPLGQVGQEAFPGWKIASVKRFARAFVGADGLVESQSGAENPAVDVTVTDGKGTTERHTAFANFADMVMSKVIEGAGASGAKLAPAGKSAAEGAETLIVFGPVGATRIGYIGPDGVGRVLEGEGAFPRTLDLGTRQVTLQQQLTRARAVWRTVRANPMKDNRPALVVRTGDSTELAVLAWNSMTPVGGSGSLMLRFGPKVVQLPFTIRLADFRKTDYPGTDMAMAYESHVGITLPGKAEVPFDIYMNHPFAYGPWKVYQSGFVGENLSVFSIMRDPGLPLTYGASIVLCVGIAVTFFSRSLSWGHPGIPAASAEKEQVHASVPHPCVDDRPVVLVQRADACGV